MTLSLQFRTKILRKFILKCLTGELRLVYNMPRKAGEHLFDVAVFADLLQNVNGWCFHSTALRTSERYFLRQTDYFALWRVNCGQTTKLLVSNSLFYIKDLPFSIRLRQVNRQR